MFFNTSNSSPEVPPERYWDPLGRLFASQGGPWPPLRDPKTNPRAPKDLLQVSHGAPLRALRSRMDATDNPRRPTVASGHHRDHPKAPK